MEKIAKFQSVFKIILVLGMAMPILASAANALDDFLNTIIATLNTVIVILFILLTIYFIWGVLQYVGAAGDEEKLKDGRRHMLWGLIGLAVVAAAWGIANLLVNYLGVTPGTTPVVPTF